MDITRFDYDYSDNKVFTFGLLSDIHIDSPGFDESRFISDMDYLASKDAAVFINGDLVDGIFPTDRKRYSRSANPCNEDAQINSVAEYVANKLMQYADYIDYIGIGNHEATIVKYNNVDIIKMIVDILNSKRSKELEPIRRSGYVGFINLAFSRKKEAVRRFVLWRDHGKGGASPVTKGTILLNRLYTTYDADMYWLGHSHQSLIDPNSQWSIGVTPFGNMYRKNKIGLITPGYSVNFAEREYNESTLYRSNFPEEKFFAPTGLGCGILELDLTGDKIASKVWMR